MLVGVEMLGVGVDVAVVGRGVSEISQVELEIDGTGVLDCKVGVGGESGWLSNNVQLEELVTCVLGVLRF